MTERKIFFAPLVIAQVFVMIGNKEIYEKSQKYIVMIASKTTWILLRQRRRRKRKGR